MTHNLLRDSILKARRDMEYYYIKRKKKEKLDESFKGQFCKHQIKAKFKEINKNYISCKVDPSAECPYKSLEYNTCLDLEVIFNYANLSEHF